MRTTARARVAVWSLGVPLVSAVHLALSYSLFGLLYSWGESDLQPSLLIRSLSVVAWILLFPLAMIELFDRWFQVPDVVYEIGFVVNSLVWGLCVVWFALRIMRRRETGSLSETAS